MRWRMIDASEATAGRRCRDTVIASVCGDTPLYRRPHARHEPGAYHPESPSRLAAILTRLRERAVADVELREPPRASEAELSRVHSPEHVRAILALAGKSEALD